MMNLKKIEKPPKIGDYVFCSRWSDRNPCDPWRIGVLEEIVSSGKFLVRGDQRYYPNCQVISHVQGILILGFYPSLENVASKDWDNRIKSIGDQNVIEFFNWFLKSPNIDVDRL